METAQEIADRVIKPGPDDEFLIECMARVICKILQPTSDPNVIIDYGEGLGPRPYWKTWEHEARMHLLCDIVMRGVRDRLVYERFKTQEG